MKKILLRIIKKTKFGKLFFSWLTKRKKLNENKCINEENPINEKQIIFSSFQGRLYACSPRAIYEYMISCEEFKDYTFIWAFNRPNIKKSLFNDRRTIIVKYNSREFYKYLASSKYWIFNFKTTPYFIKKDGQVFLQCWHGTPLKRIGMDIAVDGNLATKKDDIHQSYLDDAKKYDYFISPSKYATEKFISSFGLNKLEKENIIIEKGYPRNSELFDVSKDKLERIKTDLNIPENKKVILYCPTFRDNQYIKGVGHTYELGVNLLRLKEKLPKDYFILLRLHYLVSNNINISQFKGFALDVSNYDNINDLYEIADMLITDYSSVFFDYANLKKPILFYMYDLEEYKNNLRDFYINLDELPGLIIQSEKELIDILKLNNFNDLIPTEKYINFCNKYTYLDDNSATERVVKELFKNEVN